MAKDITKEFVASLPNPDLQARGKDGKPRRLTAKEAAKLGINRPPPNR